MKEIILAIFKDPEQPTHSHKTQSRLHCRSFRLIARLLVLSVMLLAGARISLLAGSALPTGDHPLTILANGQFVYGPNVAGFDLATYLAESSPSLFPLASVLEEQASYHSINPRVLLVILEMRSGATAAIPPLSQQQLEHAVGYEDSGGFSDQLARLCEQLVENYYRRLYGEHPDADETILLSLSDGSTESVPAATNAGTLAILSALAPLSSHEQWQEMISLDDPRGFAQTYHRLFPEDDPLDDSNQVTAPEAPPSWLLKLPFACNDTWNFSGGPHDSDGDCAGGDPYSAVDFAPGVSYCVIPTSRWIVSPASGTVSSVTCGDCLVRVNHQDGWGSYFFHVANSQVVNGQSVNTDQNIGNPSTKPTCGGDCGTCTGSATGTHVHYALTYNGAFVAIEGTSLEGWVVHGTTCYDGYLENDGQQVLKGESVTSTDCSGTCCGCLPASCCSAADVAQSSTLPTTAGGADPGDLSRATLPLSTTSSICQTASTGAAAPIVEEEMESVVPEELALLDVDLPSVSDASELEPSEELAADVEPVDTPESSASLAQWEAVEPQRIPPASANYSIVKSVFGSGGGKKTSANYVMNSTQGQSTDLSDRGSASYRLLPGYWGISSPLVFDYQIYLPVILRNH